MAVPIEGFAVVAQKERIRALLDENAVSAPNSTALSDDDLWCCSFMAHADAQEFLQVLQELELNVSQGPDSDVVLVNEFDRSVEPYCEWLSLAEWEKSVIAWKTGTEPKSIVARDGWDPAKGSGLAFHNPAESDSIEFLRLEDNVEVYLNKETGKEVYIGRTSVPIETTFKVAADVITQHFVSAGQPKLSGEAHQEVSTAVAQLDEVLAKEPDFWNAHWFLGKGHLALGDNELAYKSFLRAFEIESTVEAIPRELCGVCLELGRFEEAVNVAEKAVSLVPDSAELLGNLALAYLLSGSVAEAKKTITAALKMDSNDSINIYLETVINEVAGGVRDQPKSLADLQGNSRKRKKKFWEFWKS